MSRQKFYIISFLLLTLLFSAKPAVAILTLNATTISSDGALNLTSASNVGVTGNLRVSDGTSSLPIIGFGSEPTMGAYRVSSGIMGFSGPRFQFGPAAYATTNGRFTFTGSGDTNTAIFGKNDTGESRVTNEAMNGFAFFQVINDNTTGGVPAALTSGTPIGGLKALGSRNTGGAYNTAVPGVSFEAAENWSNSANGSRFRLVLATIGTTSVFDALSITSAAATFVPPIVASSALNKGTCVLGTSCATITVSSGAICTATDTTAIAATRAVVSGTTLTITGTGTDTIAYICL